jgi:predicted phage-related endonuclease
MKRIKKPVHGSLEWLQVRHRDENGRVIFGASEAGALMGKSEYTTLADLCVAKLGEPEVTEPTRAMLKGIYFEQGLIDFAADELGLPLVTPDEMYAKGRFIVTLDGAWMVNDHPERIVECKVTSYSVTTEQDLPVSWVLQGHVQQWVTGAPVTFAVFDRQQNLSLIDMTYDPVWADQIVTMAEFVGASLDEGVIPENAWEVMTAGLVQKVYAPEPGKAIVADDELINYIVDLENTKRLIKELEADKAISEDQIARRMLDAETVTDAEGHVLLSWKQQKGRTSFDSKRFAQEHPELFSEYSREGSPFRVMRFGKAK